MRRSLPIGNRGLGASSTLPGAGLRWLAVSRVGERPRTTLRYPLMFAPVPATLPLHLRLVRDPLAALASAAELGDVVAFKRPRGPLVVLSHPDDIDQLLRLG